ncbi:MAG: STAS domain-containing protein [Phycisphaerales bacterium]
MLSVQSVPEASINGVVITFKGDMTGTTADQLATELKKIADTKPANAVLDLAGLTMMDSRSIGLLTAFRSTLARANGGRARVMAASASPMIEKAMRITRMNELFPLHLSVAEAVRAIGEGEQAPAGRR